MKQPSRQRPTFIVVLRAEPDVVDAVKALRAGLKRLLRSHGLRAISVSDQTKPPEKS